ncbi:hypothetical protein OLR56_00005, partial [Campylobacter jejuni]|nr:hypothetical protein [Campylobacter jejuni]
MENYLILVVEMECILSILKYNRGGIEPYGIDIVPSLKKVWEKDPCLDSKNFHIISPNSSFKKLFNTKMDFIFANQSLYYLTKQAF